MSSERTILYSKHRWLLLPALIGLGTGPAVWQFSHEEGHCGNISAMSRDIVDSVQSFGSLLKSTSFWMLLAVGHPLFVNLSYRIIRAINRFLVWCDPPCMDSESGSSASAPCQTSAPGPAGGRPDRFSPCGEPDVAPLSGHSESGGGYCASHCGGEWPVWPIRWIVPYRRCLGSIFFLKMDAGRFLMSPAGIDSSMED